MPKFETPDERTRKLIMQNRIDPGPDNNNNFCIVFRDESTIVLRNFKTRDDITIHKGDRKW